MLIKKFAKSIIDLHVNFWSISWQVRYVVCNIAVKLMQNSDTVGIVIRITMRKDTEVKIISKLVFLLTPKQLAVVVLSLT